MSIERGGRYIPRVWWALCPNFGHFFLRINVLIIKDWNVFIVQTLLRFRTFRRRGRDANGRKLRWSKARKEAARKMRERRGTSGANFNLFEQLPSELGECVLGTLDRRDQLKMMTLSRRHVRRFSLERVNGLRNDIKEESQQRKREAYAHWLKEQEAREARKREDEERKEATYYDRLEEAKRYFVEVNLRRRIQGVSYKSVAKRFEVLTGDLREEVENSFISGDDHEDFMSMVE